MTETARVRVKITNELGLHARAATRLVELAGDFDAALFLAKDEQEVNGESIMEVLLLTANRGSEIEIRGEGPDASALVAAVRELIENKFGEER